MNRHSGLEPESTEFLEDYLQQPCRIPIRVWNLQFGISEVGSWFKEHLDSGFHRNDVVYEHTP